MSRAGILIQTPRGVAINLWHLWLSPMRLERGPQLRAAHVSFAPLLAMSKVYFDAERQVGILQVKPEAPKPQHFELHGIVGESTKRWGSRT